MGLQPARGPRRPALAASPRVRPLQDPDQNPIEYEIVYTMLDAGHDLDTDTQQAINAGAVQMVEDLA